VCVCVFEPDTTDEVEGKMWELDEHSTELFDSNPQTSPSYAFSYLRSENPNKMTEIQMLDFKKVLNSIFRASK